MKYMHPCFIVIALSAAVAVALFASGWFCIPGSYEAYLEQCPPEQGCSGFNATAACPGFYIVPVMAIGTMMVWFWKEADDS